MNTDTLENIAHLPIDISNYIDTIMAASRFVQGKKDVVNLFISVLTNGEY